MAEKITTTLAKDTKKEPVFTKAELISSAHVLGTIPAILTGALYEIKKETITREEAKKALESFLARPVGKRGK